MASISTYGNDYSPQLEDRLFGTATSGPPNNNTANFIVSDILNLFKLNVSLQSVLDVSNLATKDLTLIGNFILSGIQYGKQNTPIAISTASIVTGADLINGIIVNIGYGWNLPTGVNLDIYFLPTLLPASFDWSVINTFTSPSLLSQSAGHTLVGNLTIAASSSAQYRTVKTGVSTYVTYRIS